MGVFFAQLLYDEFFTDKCWLADVNEVVHFGTLLEGGSIKELSSITLHSKLRPLKFVLSVKFALFKTELSWEYESSSKSGGDNTQLVCSNWEALIKGEF